MKTTTQTRRAAFLSLRKLGRGAACLALAAPLLARAQTGLAPAMPSADPAASASMAPIPSNATTRRPVPQVTGPSDASRSLDLNNPQPEGKVTPQLRIPLGKRGDTPIVQRRRSDSGTATGANAVNEGAARCDAQIGAQSRNKCREQLTREPSK